MFVSAIVGAAGMWFAMRHRLVGDISLDNQSFIVRGVVPTLAFVIIAMTVTLLHGLFVPSVDNKELFAIIGPAFQTIVGAFVGFLGGYSAAKQQAREEAEAEAKVQAERVVAAAREIPPAASTGGPMEGEKNGDLSPPP
jgi:hypothetical protein